MQQSPTIDVESLQKLLALLASDQDGEVLAAVRAAKAMLQRHGMRFEELRPFQGCNDALEIPRWALLWGKDCLSDWEFEFCTDLIRRRVRRLSEKQQSILLRIRTAIYEKHGASAAKKAV